MDSRRIDEYLAVRIEAAFAARDLPRGVYAVSLWLSFQDDDPRAPVLQAGFNTEVQVLSRTDAASDAIEARWNFAFWLQNEVEVIGGDDDHDGAASFTAWLREDCGLWFTDEDEHRAPDHAAEVAEQIEQQTLRMIADTAALLHERARLTTTLGAVVPIIAHRLEYDDEVAGHNERVNPSGVLPPEFGAFCRSP